MFREVIEEDYGASSCEDRAASLRPQPLRVFAEQHPSRVLDRAADLLAEPGKWTQGEFERDGSYCVIGAIMEVTGAPLLHRAVMRATELLIKVLPAGTIPDWNDAPERTQAEVVEALRRAAALARTPTEIVEETGR